MSKIFISYRPLDSEISAERIYRSFARRWGGERVLMDIDPTSFGDGFEEMIDRALMDCAMVVVLIGKNWARFTDGDGRESSIAAPDDFIHLEVAAALKRRIRVVPLLLNGASVPKAAELPEDLQALVRRNAMALRVQTFDRDVEELMNVVDRLIEKPESDRSGPPPALDLRSANGGPVEERRDRQTEVFISYAREDRDIAAALARALTTEGHEVWWDFEMIGGDDFEAKIERRLESADCVIVLWSAHSIRSNWVKGEARAARERNVLIPVLIEAVKQPLDFRSIHAIDLSTNSSIARDEAALEVVCSHVNAKLANVPQPTPKAPPAGQIAPQPANSPWPKLVGIALAVIGISGLVIYQANIQEEARLAQNQVQSAQTELRAQQEKLAEERKAREAIETRAKGLEAKALKEREQREHERIAARKADEQQLARQQAEQKTRDRVTPEVNRIQPIPYDLTRLHPEVKEAVMRARAAQDRAEKAAERARNAVNIATVTSDKRYPGTDLGIGKFKDDSYFGTFELDPEYGRMRHGFGVYNYANNENNSGPRPFLRYEGEFAKGDANGVGKLYWVDGASYAGDFKKWRRIGVGVYKTSTGARYEGEFTESRYGGIGVRWESDGRGYVAGVWRQDNLVKPMPLNASGQ